MAKVSILTLHRIQTFLYNGYCVRRATAKDRAVAFQPWSFKFFTAASHVSPEAALQSGLNERPVMQGGRAARDSVLLLIAGFDV